MGTQKKMRRREHSFALDRDHNYTVLLRSFLSKLTGAEFLILGYLISLPPGEHPAERQMAIDLAMSARGLKRALADLKSKGVIFQDFAKFGAQKRAIWNIAHPCRWRGSDLPVIDSIDPFAHQPRRLVEAGERINEARSYILNHSESFRLPNILFRVHISWRARFLYAYLCSLPEERHPSISELTASLSLNKRTARRALDVLGESGMIAVEREKLRTFGGGWLRQYFHMTDVYDWKFAVARRIYSAPKRSILRTMGLHTVEPSWQESRKDYEPQHVIARLDTSVGGAFGIHNQQKSAADEMHVLQSGIAFGACSSALQLHTSAFGMHTSADMPPITTLEATSRKGLGPYNNTFKESMEESHAREPAGGDAIGSSHSRQAEKRQLSARIINIADSSAHVWVNSRGRRCDPGLWSETVDEVAAIGGEAAARRFVRYATEVFLARGRRPMAYNSLAMEDLRDGFLRGAPAVELAGIGTDEAGGAAAPKIPREREANSDNAAVPSNSNEKPAPIAFVSSQDEDQGEAGRGADEPRSGAPASVRSQAVLRDLPEDENRMRWLVHEFWPKVRRTWKAEIARLWTIEEPRAALHSFAGQEPAFEPILMAAAGELLKKGILPKAPPLPWETRAEVTSVPTPDLPVPSSMAAESAQSLARARLNEALSLLARDFKMSTRFSMEKGFARLSDEDFLKQLGATFSEDRVQEVLRDIP